jgi:streptomycin 3"-adenylyltransferase
VIERPSLTQPEIRQLAAVDAVLHDVIGDALLGSYLHGSAVAGGLRPRSDLDVLVVITGRLGDPRALVARLLDVSRPPGVDPSVRPLEVTIVAKGAISPWRYPPEREFQFGEWWRERFQAGDAEVLRPTRDPDLALLIEAARAADVPLAGPPARDSLPDVPAADLARASLDSLPGLIRTVDGDTANVVLTLARVWRTVSIGDLVPKDVAASWALERIATEHRDVLEHARDVYLGVVAERWSDRFDGVSPCARALVAEIEASRPSAMTGG